MKIPQLCERYQNLSTQERVAQLFEDFDNVLVTSSFGSTAIVLLHHIHKVKPDHPIHFIDTTYHFKETLDYKQRVIDKLQLNVVDVKPPKIENTFTKTDWTWTYAPDVCCEANKVMPMDKLKGKHDIWISGMFGGRNERRRNMPLFKHDGTIMRSYPLIDMDEQDVSLYMYVHELPVHPLVGEGYDSIGCTHCTRPGKGREGRWTGFNKTECGLHVFGK